MQHCAQGKLPHRVIFNVLGSCDHHVCASCSLNQTKSSLVRQQSVCSRIVPTHTGLYELKEKKKKLEPAGCAWRVCSRNASHLLAFL